MELLDQGVSLMLVGMGTVFSFLTILVAAMSLMSYLAVRFAEVDVANDASDEEVAAISAAINQHNQRTLKRPQ